MPAFYKYQGNGNDFIIFDSPLFLSDENIRRFCDRKFGIGADGIVVLYPSKKADVWMRIYNSDGSEATCCGNALVCTATFLKAEKKQNISSIETLAGVIQVSYSDMKVSLQMMPCHFLASGHLMIDQEEFEYFHIDSGVEHAIVFVEDLKKTPVKDLGRKIRCHQRFSPGGVNVDFVQIFSDGKIFVRTYEKGVEDETLSCGTGAIASAIAYNKKCMQCKQVKVRFQYGDYEVDLQHLDKDILGVVLKSYATKVFEGKISL
ncbi:MAG TPA: diaminopimelate epimerase [Chlamydiales bacterium]|nr:diaminopimelate epimerase [Chlamydiales bacterium]